MINKNKWYVAFSALVCTCWCFASMAEDKQVYNCAANSVASQRIYLNIGNENRRLQLSIPVHTSGHSQHDIDSIQHCLYKNNLLTPEKATAYVKVYIKCRAQYYDNKIQVNRSSENKKIYTTKKPQNLNQCMASEMLKANEAEK